MDRLTVMLATTTLVFGATTAWLAKQLSSERQHSASVSERMVELESARDRASGRPMPGADSTSAADGGPSDLPAEPNAPRSHAGRAGAVEAFTQFRLSEAQRLRSPRYRESWLAMTALSLRRTYPDLQRILGLSEAEYADFLETMAQFELELTLRNYELALENRRDLAERLTASHRALTEAQDARRLALRDALGETRFQQWIDHQRTAQGRQELERWRIELAVAGQPLTQDQAQDLLPILVEHQKRSNALPNDAALIARALVNSADASSALVESERHIASRAEINEWLGDALIGVLTAEQRDLMTRSGQREIELSRAQLELNRLRLESATP